ncbi:MAG: hypothetical protein KAI45_09990 [Melioribacteraceae bacterium]|nr:hypothetical protein [Melioribacteraceae bacterium]
MKTITLITKMTVILFALLLASSVFAQDNQQKKACKDDCKMECCAKEVKHVCDDECKANGCTDKVDKPCCSKKAKHVCNDECKANGCTAMKVSFECPMKCEPASDKPGECSKCGMELKKKA